MKIRQMYYSESRMIASNENNESKQFDSVAETNTHNVNDVSQLNTAVSYIPDREKEIAFDLCCDSALWLAEKLRANIFANTLNVHTAADDKKQMYGVITFESDIYSFNQMNKIKQIKENLKLLIEFADDLVIEASDNSCGDTTKSYNIKPNESNNLIKITLTYKLYKEVVLNQ